MASVKVTRRVKAAAGGEPQTAVARHREQVEERVRFLAQEETRLAREGFYEGAQEAARERRYWEFLRALMDAPLGHSAVRGVVH